MHGFACRCVVTIKVLQLGGFMIISQRCTGYESKGLNKKAAEISWANLTTLEYSLVQPKINKNWKKFATCCIHISQDHVQSNVRISFGTQSVEPRHRQVPYHPDPPAWSWSPGPWESFHQVYRAADQLLLWLPSPLQLPLPPIPILLCLPTVQPIQGYTMSFRFHHNVILFTTDWVHGTYIGND